jgi:hypothetical protein
MALFSGCGSQSLTSDQQSAPSASHAQGDPSASPTAPQSAAPAASAGSVGTVDLAPVSVQEPVTVAQGLTFEVTTVNKIDVQAVTPGDIAGPGIEVEVRATNNSGAPADLAQVSVSAQYGDLPASPISGTDPLSDPLAAGKSAMGTYQFRTPDSASGSLTIRISYSQSSDVVVVKP